MRPRPAVSSFFSALLLLPIAVFAQSAQDQSASVPRLITITGVYRPADGKPPAAVETVTLVDLRRRSREARRCGRRRSRSPSMTAAATPSSSAPPTPTASRHRCSRPAGSGSAPSSNARAKSKDRASRLTSVPYAMRAAEADTLGGHPASDYLLATGATGDGKSATAATDARHHRRAGRHRQFPRQIRQCRRCRRLRRSTRPAARSGSARPRRSICSTSASPTPAAVSPASRCRTSATPRTSYSGMLFYDQNNGSASSRASTTSPTNTASTTSRGSRRAARSTGRSTSCSAGRRSLSSRPTATSASAPPAPSALLEVSNAVPGGPANMWMTSFTNVVGPYYMARRARGTPAAPTAVQNGDGLAGFYGQGYGTTAFGPAFTGGMTVQAAQNWTDTAQGTALTFTTTAINATAPTTRMTLDATGNLGIGTTTTPAAGLLEVSNAANSTPIGNCHRHQLYRQQRRRVRFSSAARRAGRRRLLPRSRTATTSWAFWAADTVPQHFSGTRGGMFVRASENWTDTAQGTSLNFNTTANGTNTPGTRMTIDHRRATSASARSIPAAALEIVRHRRDHIVGTSYNDDDGERRSSSSARARNVSRANRAFRQGTSLATFGAGGTARRLRREQRRLWSRWSRRRTGPTRRHGNLHRVRDDAAGHDRPRSSIGAFCQMAIVGIGTPADVDGIPTATDRLQVFGDIRVGTTGTNGCLKNFAGTGIVGTCSSDRRLKKNITPFAPVLDQLTALQPVHYFWRSDGVSRAALRQQPAPTV